MLSVQDPEILSLVPDYRINLFSPAEIKDEELNKLESNLKEVMLFIKYSKDKRKLQELTSQSPGFRSFELKAARVIDSITGINLRFTETERSVNMCQAVQEMCDDARAEGHASGLSEGHAKGLQDHALLTAQRMLIPFCFHTITPMIGSIKINRRAALHSQYPPSRFILLLKINVKAKNNDASKP